MHQRKILKSVLFVLLFSPFLGPFYFTLALLTACLCLVAVPIFFPSILQGTNHGEEDLNLGQAKDKDQDDLLYYWLATLSVFAVTLWTVLGFAAYVTKVACGKDKHLSNWELVSKIYETRWEWGLSQDIDLSELGDSFGAFNALFSALAVMFVLLNLWLQRRDLRSQREELIETRTMFGDSSLLDAFRADGDIGAYLSKIPEFELLGLAKIQLAQARIQDMTNHFQNALKSGSFTSKPYTISKELVNAEIFVSRVVEAIALKKLVSVWMTNVYSNGLRSDEINLTNEEFDYLKNKLANMKISVIDIDIDAYTAADIAWANTARYVTQMNNSLEDANTYSLLELKTSINDLLQKIQIFEHETRRDIDEQRLTLCIR